ncbi:hypothetical protein GCM10011352_38280 [Marinobacterium zhoushanense]|uniref:Uracil-DNA glycosylase-like domain-containing protein n=1 Tax=Marinobacterium zhoushanense TaxID=1679163 RepID=A0ABQ1KU87_9GAMM|nr:hypothetical protein [Marinobacterium zhoushanense]GGC08270.1 hypothetical protein GCM10011352_38280 [Marinobacterium zhoushanense]
MDLSGEQLRHQYLEAIGISSWLPRARLPGAAPSDPWVERFHYPLAEEGDGFADFADAEIEQPSVDTPAAKDTTLGPEVVSAAAQTARSQARASIAPLIDSGQPTQTPVTTAAARAEVVEQPSAPVRRGPPVQAPRVKLAFVLAGDLLIVDSLPPAARLGFSAQHQKLLSGIARALGVTEPASDAALLSWPVLAGATLDQGPQELAKAVRRKLELTLALRSVKRAVLLGESAAQWVLEREETLDALRGIRFTLRPELHCIASVSLSQALQLPELKAELWRDLQPLLTHPS